MTASDAIADVDASGLWPGKVVTELSPAGDFWEAEPEYQDYLEHYPSGYTCHYVRPEWKLPPQTLTRKGLYRRENATQCHPLRHLLLLAASRCSRD
jgi:hypothetical protein